METLEDVIQRMYDTPIVTKFESELLCCIKEMETEIERIEKISERRADLLLKAEALQAKNQELELVIAKLHTALSNVQAREKLLRESFNSNNVKKPYHQWIKPFEEIYFKYLMEIMDNNQSKTSEMAGLNRGTVRKKLKQYNLIQG